MAFGCAELLGLQAGFWGGKVFDCVCTKSCGSGGMRCRRSAVGRGRGWPRGGGPTSSRSRFVGDGGAQGRLPRPFRCATWGVPSSVRTTWCIPCRWSNVRNRADRAWGRGSDARATVPGTVFAVHRTAPICVSRVGPRPGAFVGSRVAGGPASTIRLRYLPRTGQVAPADPRSDRHANGPALPAGRPRSVNGSVARSSKRSTRSRPDAGGVRDGGVYPALGGRPRVL